MRIIVKCGTSSLYLSNKSDIPLTCILDLCHFKWTWLVPRYESLFESLLMLWYVFNNLRTSSLQKIKQIT